MNAPPLMHGHISLSSPSPQAQHLKCFYLALGNQALEKKSVLVSQTFRSQVAY